MKKIELMHDTAPLGGASVELQRSLDDDSVGRAVSESLLPREDLDAVGSPGLSSTAAVLLLSGCCSRRRSASRAGERRMRGRFRGPKSGAGVAAGADARAGRSGHVGACWFVYTY